MLALPESINNVGFTNYTFLIGIGKAHIIALVQFFNVEIISSFLILGFVLFNNIFGLLGYFFTVVIVNLFILLYIKRLIGFSIYTYLKKIKAYKLLLLLIMLLIGPIVLYQNIWSISLTLGLLSVFSFFIFANDLKQYSGVFVKYLMGKND